MGVTELVVYYCHTDNSFPARLTAGLAGIHLGTLQRVQNLNL